MRILWYNWRDIKNPAAGGAEVFTHEVCRRLVGPEHGHAITLFTSAFEGGAAEEEIDGVRIVRRGGRYSVYGEARKYYRSHGHEFDLVVDEINTRPFMAPAFVKDRPVIALIHQLAREFWFYETPFPVNLMGYLFLEKHWLRRYRNVPTITVSESTRQDLLSLGFEDIHVVPEGLDFRPLDRPAQKESVSTLLFVGRLKKAKKPDDAIRAFTILEDEIPQAKMWVVGDGYMAEELKAMAVEHAREPKIVFFGKVSNKKKLELMSRAHVLLVPGVREGWGLVVTEANAMGTPAVAYDVPGLRDSVVDGVTGVLVQKDDYVGLAIEASQLLKDRQALATLSIGALQNSRQFHWDRTAAVFVSTIDRYVGKQQMRATVSKLQATKDTSKEAVSCE
jgi:glycosyltransferase involved in cell wall biosynthesis